MRNSPDVFSRWTSLALALAAVCALIGVATGGGFGRALDSVSLLLLGTLPVLRVAVLSVRWSRSGDRRYASAAVALLLLMAMGVVVIAVWR